MDSHRPSAQIAATCAVGLGLVMFDNTAVTVALPRIGDDFAGSITVLQWVASVAPLAAAAALVGSGAAGDRWGARRGVVLGLLAWGVGATGCLTAPSIGVLLVARALQGLGAALMLPNGAALLGANVPAGKARDRAVAWWITTSALGLVAGPLAGGWTVEHLGWRWIFAVHLPFVVLGIIGTAQLAETRATARGRLDLAGIALAAVGLGLLCTGLINLGRADAGTTTTVVVLAAAAIALTAFVAAERRARRPALDLALLRGRSFAAVVGASLIYNGSIAGGSFLVSLLFQGPRGFSAGATGVVLLLATVGMPLGGQLTGRIAHRGGVRPVMVSGTAVLALAYAVAAVLALGPAAAVVVPLAVTGFAAGVLYSGDTLAVLGTADPARSASALATLSLVRQVGAVLGVALLGSLAGAISTQTDQAGGLRAGLLVAGALVVPACLWLWRRLDARLGLVEPGDAVR